MIALILGILSVALLPQLPPLGPTAGVLSTLVLLVSGLLLLLLSPQQRLPVCVQGSRHRTLLVSALQGLLGLLLGLAWGLGYGYGAMEHRLPENWQGKDLQVTGQVDSLVSQSSSYCRFLVQTTRLQSAQPLTPAIHEHRWPRHIQLTDYQCQTAPEPGAEGQWLVRLKVPMGFRNPGGMDRQRYLLSQRIDATGYIKATLISPLAPQLNLSIDAWRQQLSNWLAVRMQQLNGEPAPERAALLQALLVGDKRGLSDNQWQMLRATGTVHLMIISGLHIGLVCAFVYVAASWLGRLTPSIALNRRRLLAVALALSAATAYALLAGFTLPTQRALIMTSVVLLSLVLGQHAPPLKRTLLAAALVLLLDPLAGLSAGFWLSFAATAALLYLCAQRNRQPADTKTGGRRLSHHIRYAYEFCRPVWVVQLAMLAVSAPLLAWWFYTFPWVSPLINMLAVPLVSFLLLPLALLALLLVPVLPLWGSTALFWVAAALDTGLHEAYLFSTWSQAFLPQWSIGQPAVPALLLALCGALLLLAPRMWPGRWLGAVLMLPLVFGMTPPPLAAGTFRLTLLDVGQGLAIHVETANHRLLFDTGMRYSSGLSVAALTIDPYLQHQGVRQVDALVLSHDDRDHAGGLEFLSQRYEIDRLISHGASQASAVSHVCRRGLAWQWDGVHFQFLHPAATGLATADSENNRSCVLKVQGDWGSVLLSGDIEAAVERQLVKTENLRADVLVVPHHGSLTSSTAAFIAAVQPRWALVSAGYRNPYGHPHAKVLTRYQRAGVKVWQTSAEGAIRIDFDRPELQPESYVREQRHYWW